MKKHIIACWKRILEDFIEYKWALAGILIYYICVRLRFHAFCPMVIVTGFPCPGCGMTRAVFFMLTGQIRRSWNLNPLAGGWILLAAWFLYRRYWCGKKVKEVKYIGILLIVAMIFIYIYRMINIFPSYAPMVYTKHNILSEIFEFYEDINKAETITLPVSHIWKNQCRLVIGCLQCWSCVFHV